MPLTTQQQLAFRAIARTIEGIDVEVYRRFSKDALEPILGYGSESSRVGFFGRDPGRDEVQYGEPFIGAGGQWVRRALYQRLHAGQPLPDLEASRAVGRPFFWANTVPYKPVGNKAWSTRIKQQFQPLVARQLVEHWQGDSLITLGREAFLWFGLLQTREVRQRLDAFWESEDRFNAFIEVTIASRPGHARTIKLYPLPHPSPLNATWYKRFPALLDARLEQLGVGVDY